MSIAFSLAMLFAIIGEIIIRFAIVGGGIGLAMAYIYWAANRYEDHFLKFMLVVIGPILFVIITFNALMEFGVIR